MNTRDPGRFSGYLFKLVGMGHEPEFVFYKEPWHSQSYQLSASIESLTIRPPAWVVGASADRALLNRWVVVILKDRPEFCCSVRLADLEPLSPLEQLASAADEITA